MPNSREMMRIIQGARQACFPKGRIAFCKQAVAADQTAMKEWATNPHKSFDWLRRQIAYNNYLDEYYPDGMIPFQAMKDTVRMLGWVRRVEDDG